MITKHEYISVKQQLVFKRNYLVTLGILIVDVAIFLLGLCLLNLAHPLSYVGSQIFIAIFFFHNFTILHECGHENCSSSRMVNDLTGLYASMFSFFPYFPWKYIHQQHHLWAGNLHKDPVLANLKKFKEADAVPPFVRFAWKSWIPFAGFLQYFVYWSYPLVMMKEGNMTLKKFVQCVFSVLLVPCAFTLLSWRFPQVFTIANFGLAFVMHLLIIELINFPHHIAMPLFDRKLRLWEQHQVTRSAYYPKWFSEFFLLNFNFHTEHHWFPSLPWYQLRKARHVMKPALGEAYHETMGISWNISARQKDMREVIGVCLQTRKTRPFFSSSPQ